MTNFEQNVFDLGRDVQKFHPSYTILLQVVYTSPPKITFLYFGSLEDTIQYLVSQKRPQDELIIKPEDSSLIFHDISDIYFHIYHPENYKIIVQRLEETFHPTKKVIPKTCQTEVCDLNLPEKVVENPPKPKKGSPKRIVKKSPKNK